MRRSMLSCCRSSVSSSAPSGRSTATWSRCWKAPSRTASCRPGARVPPERDAGAAASRSAARPSSAPIASSSRAGCCAATSGAARSCAPRRSRPARRSRGAARSPPPRCARATRRCATRCGIRPTRGCCRLRPASRRIDCFPDRGVPARRSTRVLDASRHAAWRPRSDRRAAGAARARSPSATACRRESVLVLSGAQQGLDLLARCLIDPGDAVIVDRPGLSGRDSVVPRRGREVDRLGHRARRHRRARGSARALPAEADLHEPDVPESDRRRRCRSARGASCCRSRSAIACRSSRTRPTAICTSARRRRRRCASSTTHEPRDLPEQLLEGAWRRACGSAGSSAAPSIVDQIAIIKQRLDPHTPNLGAVRDRAADAAGDVRRAPAHDPRGAREALHADDRGDRRHMPPGSIRFARPAGGLYLWCRLGAGPQCDGAARSRARQRRHVRAGARRSIPDPRATPSCASASRACCLRRSRRASSALARCVGEVRLTAWGWRRDADGGGPQRSQKDRKDPQRSLVCDLRGLGGLCGPPPSALRHSAGRGRGPSCRRARSSTRRRHTARGAPPAAMTSERQLVAVHTWTTT